MSNRTLRVMPTLGQLSSIRSAEPDVIYIPGYYGDVALIAKQARMIGLTQPLLGADGWDAPELWQSAATP